MIHDRSDVSNDKAAGVLDSMVRIPRAALTTAMVDTLTTELSYANPAVRGGSKRRPDARLTSLTERDGAVLIPRGAVGLVEAKGIRLDDRRLTLPPVTFTLRRELRGYQAEARDAAVHHGQGVLVIPTGGGKTLAALGIIAAIGQPALVIVPTLDLLDQWATAVRADLGVEPALCASGSFTLGPITLALPGTLGAPDRLAAARTRFGLVLVDEAHHVASAGYRAILDALPARYRFGVTATPLRGDTLAPLVGHYLGPVLFRAAASDLADRGFLVRPRREEVRTDFMFAYGGPSDWGPLLEALIVDDVRNRLIADLVARECVGGAVGLVLTGRIAHVDGLVAMLRARGLRADAITGEHGKARRSASLDAARAGTLDVLVATALADEGLDVPRLARLFMVFPSKSEARLVQRVGRVLRPHSEKDVPAVFDLVDHRVPLLARHAAKRADAFRRAWEEEGAGGS